MSRDHPHVPPVPSEEPPRDWPGHADPALALTLRYWDDLRAGRHAPARTEIDPDALLPALSLCALLERPRPGTIRLRLGGGRVAALMGMEVRGMPLRALFAMPDRPALMSAAEAVFAQPAILRATLRAPGAHGAVAVPMALLPLTDAEGALARGLLVLGRAAQAAPACTPCRLSLSESWLTPIRRGVPLPATRSVRERGAPRLRVIEGGRR